MFYILIAIHAYLVTLARRVRRGRGLQWSNLDMAVCWVVPVPVLIFWIPVAGFSFSSWLPAEFSTPGQELIWIAIMLVPPESAFWAWFFWRGLKHNPPIEEG